MKLIDKLQALVDMSKVQKNSYDISQDKHYYVEDTTWYKQQNRSMFRPAGYPRPMGNWFGDTIKEQFDDMKSPSYFVVNKEQAKKIKQYNKGRKMNTVRDILDKYKDSIVTEIKDGWVHLSKDTLPETIALKEIEELLLESLPTEYKYPDSEYEQYYHEGWNSYLEHTHKAIKRVIGGRDE